MFDFNIPRWAALLLGLALLITVARLCYSRINTENHILKLSITFTRTIATAALLLLAFDATITWSQTVGGRLYFISPDTHLNEELKSVSGNASLNERFQVEIESVPLDEIERRLEQSPLVQNNTAGFVIGSRTAGQASQILNLLKRRDAAPVFVAIDLTSASTPDIGITSIDSDGRAVLGAPAVIQATVYSRGMAARTTKVLLSDETRTVGSETIEWRGEKESVVVRLPFIPTVEGVNKYSLRAEPDELEKNIENNQVSFSLDVRREGRRILFIEDQPTWDGKFIRRALEAGGLFKVDYFARISRDARLAQTSPDGVRDLQKILNSFNHLARHDAIIAGPVDASALSVAQARNISDFVERRGGGLILLGNNDYVGSITSPSSPLSHLSPARVSLSSKDADKQESSIRADSAEPEKRSGPTSYLVPTQEGISEGLFRLQDEESVIEKLGPISTEYLKVNELKPGAIAYATDGSTNGPPANVLVAGQVYGLGRTLLVVPSDLWRAQLAEAKDEKGAFDSFWQNLAFWDTAGAEPPSYIRLASGSIPAGQPVSAYLTTRDESFNPLASLTVEAEAESFSKGDESPGGRIPLTLERVPEAPGVYKLTSPPLKEGKGEIRVTIRSDGQQAQMLRLGFYVQPEKNREIETPDMIDRVEREARNSGGQLFDRRDTDGLLRALMNLPTEIKSVGYEHRLRDSTAFAFLLPLLFAFEYLLRQFLLK